MRVITGSARGTTLKTPEGMLTRPTTERVKEAVFSSIHYLLPGRKVLDLFSGTGQMGIEALSRGAERCVFVDLRRQAAELIRENLRRAKLEEQAEVLQSDYLTYLSRCREQFDLILLDPPYAEKFLENALQKISEIDILAEDGIIITERPVEKALNGEFPGLVRLKDHRYGKIMITTFQKESAD